MSKLLEKIREEMYLLPIEEREALAEELTESVYGHDPEVDAAWDTEIQKRLAAYDNGEDAGMSMTELRGMLNQKFGWQL